MGRLRSGRVGGRRIGSRETVAALSSFWGGGIIWSM